MQIILVGHPDPVPVQPADTLLASLLRAGVVFPFSCQTGSCGSCKCELLAGEVDELDYSTHALAAAERARGIVLACRTRLRGDVVVRRID